MTYFKFIRTHHIVNTEFGNAFILLNGYSHSLQTYTQMFEEARKSFPDLKPEDIDCLVVEKSSSFQRCSIIQFPCPPDTIKEGWERCERLPI